MATAVVTEQFRLNLFAKIREILALIEEIRKIEDPFGSVENLRRAIEALLRLAEVIGIDPKWIARLREILEDENILQMVLAIARYIFGRSSREADGSIRVMLADRGKEFVVDEKAFMDWLPTVVQIISVLGQIRGDS